MPKHKQICLDARSGKTNVCSTRRLQSRSSEMLQFIRLYMGIVKVPRLHLYRNVGALYEGLLPPWVMPRAQFSSLLEMLHASDPDDERLSGGKLQKVSWLLHPINQTSARHFQFHRYISVNERMVKSKARSGIRQYLQAG